MKHKWSGPIAIDHLKHFQSIANFYYNSSSQYMSFIDILIHVVTTLYVWYTIFAMTEFKFSQKRICVAPSSDCMSQHAIVNTL